MKKVKKLVSFMLVILIAISVMMPAALANHNRQFKDLPTTHWAYSAIMNMTNEGLLSGYPDGTYGPNRTISRAEFTSVVVRILGLKGSQVPFQDVPQSYWAYSGIAAAVEAGIIVPRDYGNTFEPNVPITRLEMAKMLARGLASENETYAQYLSAFDGLYNGDLPLVDYRDFNQSDLPYLAMAFGAGIMNGYPDVTFGQDRPANRAEAAVMLASFMKAIKTNPETVQYLNELKEVAETGTNATTVSKLIPEINLTDEGSAVIDHRLFTAKLKRAYVVPIKSDVVSLYEQKYIWDRSEVPQQRIDMVAGWVIGVADVTFKQYLATQHSWSQHLWFEPELWPQYLEPQIQFNLITNTMKKGMSFEQGRTYEITFYARYNSEYWDVAFTTGSPQSESEYHRILFNPKN